MRYTKSFTKQEHCSERIVVYGAGNYGELAWAGLKRMGLKIDCFIDRSHIGEMYHGVPVKPPTSIDEYLNEIILVASLNYFDDIVNLLIEKGVRKIYDIEKLIEISSEEDLNEYAFDEKNNIDKYRNVINNFSTNELIIGHVEVVLTEKCTLRCKDCANLMQYYSNPENLELEEIMRDFDNLLCSVDKILDLRLLGGEPFVVKNIDDIINKYVNSDKIERITIYTNSTIIPNNKIIQALQHEKVVVHMSDYGEVSRNKKALISELQKNGVKYYVHQYEEWNDLGGVERRSYSLELLNRTFSQCIMAKCYTFYRGRLYLCPRAAHGERLGIFINPVDEYVEFSGNQQNIQTWKAELKALVKRKKYIKACEYCNGSSVHSKKIAAGKQKGIK